VGKTRSKLRNAAERLVQNHKSFPLTDVFSFVIFRCANKGFETEQVKKSDGLFPVFVLLTIDPAIK
jgi:hypothetical protein